MMSAIAGIIQLDGKPIDNANLDRIQLLLEPYGRDAQHQWQQGSAGLIRTLLRITPEDSHDRQPLTDADNGRVVLFDGRLDNRDELMATLGLNPTRVKTMADSELVLHACLRWDDRAVEHLLGNYAIACWHPAQRRLWLARDPLGHRPLYWHNQQDFFAFATMPKALFCIPGVPRALCEERLADNLAALPMTGPGSFFKEIYRVEPGQIVMLQDRQITTRRFHEFDPDREIQLNNDDDYLQAYREQLDRAVACQLRSAGPIASQLSSGFDSSTVTARAAEQLAQRNEELLAYTAVPRKGFAGPVPNGRHADESIAAGALAKRFDNIQYIQIQTGNLSLIDVLQQSIESLDHPPLPVFNMLWLHAINADAENRGAKVLLNGGKGNMSISYTGEHLLTTLLRQGRLTDWWREARAMKRGDNKRRWSGIVAQTISAYLPAPLWRRIAKAKGGGYGSLTSYTAIHPKFLARMGGEKGLIHKSGWDLSYRPWVDGRRMRIAIINRIDVGDYFAAFNATANLEIRDPTADLRLLEFCLAVPEHQYQRNGQSRWLLHRLMDNILPPEYLQARTKGLQAADWFETMEKELPRIRDEVAYMVKSGVAGEYLDLESLQRSLEEWPTSGWDTNEVIQTYQLKLMRGISMGSFIHYVEEDSCITSSTIR